MNIEQYVARRQKEVVKHGANIKDYEIFSLNYVPKRPLIRDEARQIIDNLVRYQETGIPRNLMVIGARGSGKTMSVKYLSRVFSQKFGLPFRYVNCRYDNSSFKILAKLLHVKPRGYSYSELITRFEEEVPGPCVIVLDEADLISTEKDQRKDILYFLSRSKRKYAVILLSNNPRFLRTLDESTRSSLQAELLHFRNYTAGQIMSILRDRAAEGLKSSEKALLAEVAALTARNTNSDIRVALKTLLYCVTKEAKTVSQSFERARQDLVMDMLNDMNDKALLILKAAMEEPSHLVKNAYKRYGDISRTMGEEPYSYVYFYNNLAYLQSVGLVTLLSAKIDRAYTNRIHPLFSQDELSAVLKARFR